MRRLDLDLGDTGQEGMGWSDWTGLRNELDIRGRANAERRGGTMDNGGRRGDEGEGVSVVVVRIK